MEEGFPVPRGRCVFGEKSILGDVPFANEMDPRSASQYRHGIGPDFLSYRHPFSSRGRFRPDGPQKRG
jgi:hypothetical protein